MYKAEHGTLCKNMLLHKSEHQVYLIEPVGSEAYGGGQSFDNHVKINDACLHSKYPLSQSYIFKQISIALK